MRAFLALLVLMLTSAAPAHAVITPGTSAGAVEEAAESLRSDPVYVDPEAEAALSEGEARELRQRIGGSDVGPMYVAVLPEAARSEGGGSTDGLVYALRREVGRPGTYVVVSGNQLRAGSDVLPVREIADRAVQEHGSQGAQAILLAIVDGVAAERSGGGAGAPGGGREVDGSGGLILLGALVLGGGAFAIARSRRRRREEAEELEEVKEQVRDELVELGDGIRALDLDVEMPNADAAAKEDYARAVAAYHRANDAWNTARRVDDLEPVGAALEEGRWAMASAKARLEGKAPPERTPPCFFDPRHGPSSRDVEWAPPGGTPRPVPACEADAQAVDRGIDPGFREVEVGGRHVPYWGAGPAFSPFYAGGMFGGFGGVAGGLLGGMILADMLDGPDIAYADPGFGGGDFGDGGFGGGDFGGGGFGGGDFGGGGFGGGDF